MSVVRRTLLVKIATVRFFYRWPSQRSRGESQVVVAKQVGKPMSKCIREMSCQLTANVGRPLPLELQAILAEFTWSYYESLTRDPAAKPIESRTP
jgi:hypothetical protein